MTNELKAFPEERSVSSTIGIGKIGSLALQNDEMKSPTYTLSKRQLTMDQALNLQPDAIKLLEENIIRKILQDIGIGRLLGLLRFDSCSRSSPILLGNRIVF